MCAFSLRSTYNTFAYFECGRMHSTAHRAPSKPSQPNRYTRLFFSVIVIFVCCFYLMWIAFFSTLSSFLFAALRVFLLLTSTSPSHRPVVCVYMRSVLARFFLLSSFFFLCFVYVSVVIRLNFEDEETDCISL